MKDKERVFVKETIEKVLTEQKPKTVKKLVLRVSELTEIAEEDIYNIVRELEKDNKINLGFPKKQRELPKKISNYLFKMHYFSIEFWLIFILSLIFLGLGFTTGNIPFLHFLKSIFGGIYIMIIPGWTITNLFFPQIYEVIDQIERILLSLGVSIGISIFSGLLLNKVWIINSIALTITIGCFSLVLLVFSVVIRLFIGSQKSKVVLDRILSWFSKRRVRE